MVLLSPVVTEAEGGLPSPVSVVAELSSGQVNLTRRLPSTSAINITLIGCDSVPTFLRGGYANLTREYPRPSISP